MAALISLRKPRRTSFSGSSPVGLLHHSHGLTTLSTLWPISVGRVFPNLLRVKTSAIVVMEVAEHFTKGETYETRKGYR
jgi:hypothetical protein